MAPLQLVSWLSWKVPEATQRMLDQLVHLFARVEPVPADQVFAIGYRHLKMEVTENLTWDMMRDALIHSVAVGGRSGPTDEVSTLMVTFL